MIVWSLIWENKIIFDIHDTGELQSLSLKNTILRQDKLQKFLVFGSSPLFIQTEQNGEKPWTNLMNELSSVSQFGKTSLSDLGELY